MNEHYYSKRPTSQLETKRIHAHLRGVEFTFETGSGTFSKNKVDVGSALLIEEFTSEPGSAILDLGCGYGPVGIALKKTCHQCTIVMTDVNERAVKLAKQNAKLNEVEVDVRKGDSYAAINELFDAIVLNPPQTAGRELCNRMIVDGKERLKTDGFFWLVARHNKGGSEFEKKLNEVFGNVETIAKQSGFRVYRSKKTI
ncbi:MAG TPA: methyltransferase [Candidatus Binatia bacterium]|nr:methyltransferase [Candidatus Binatia bacterium]